METCSLARDKLPAVGRFVWYSKVPMIWTTQLAQSLGTDKLTHIVYEILILKYNKHITSYIYIMCLFFKIKISYIFK